MKKIFQPLCFVLLGIALSACSHDDEPTPNNAPLISLGSDATFTLTEEKFETSKPAPMPASRAMAAQAQPQEVDLGDGLRATMSIEEDCEPETRTTPISQGRYTIYALDSNGDRIIGADKMLMGEVNASGVFVPDAGSHFNLPAGTYTFVCISQGVGYNGSTSLTVENSTRSPMLGKVQKTIHAGDKKCNVSFQMQHLSARVRFKLIVYTESVNDVKVYLGSNSITKTTYNLAGVKTNTFNEGRPTGYYTLSSSLTEKDTKYVLAHCFYTDYYYVQPGSNSQVYAGFSGGEIYSGINMMSKSLPFLAGTPITFARNKSYTLTIKAKPLLYLFDDGTNGALSEKGSRIPVGLVSVEKTNTREGTAAALKASHTDPIVAAQNGNKWEDLAAAGVVDGKRNVVASTNNPSSTTDEMNGYELTWSDAATVTTDSKVRATQATQYPAFYWAGHYQPGVSTTNMGKWYLPAMGEIMILYKKLFTDETFVGDGMFWGENFANNFYDAYWNYNTLNSVSNMLNALQGGVPENVFLWTSSTMDVKYTPSGPGDDYMPIAMKFSRTPFGHPMSSGARVAGKALKKNAPNVYVWPFVHF